MFTPRPFSSVLLRVSAFLVLSLVMVVSNGCHTPEPPKYFLQFYMEAPGNSGIAFTLPESKLEYRRLPGAFLNGADVTSVNEGVVGVSGVQRLCVIFTFSALGQRELYMQTANNLSRRIFLFASDKPMGVRPIDQVIQNGQLFMFVETPDQKSLEEFVADVQASQLRIAEMKKK